MSYHKILRKQNIPLGDKANLSFKGALEKFLDVLAVIGLSILSNTGDMVCALISDEYLFTGLRKGCGFCGL